MMVVSRWPSDGAVSPETAVQTGQP